MHTKCFFSVYILINFNTKIKFLVFRHTKILFFILEVKYTIKPTPLSDISETENLFHCVGRNATALIYCRRCRYPKSKYIYIYIRKNLNFVVIYILIKTTTSRYDHFLPLLHVTIKKVVCMAVLINTHFLIKKPKLN